MTASETSASAAPASAVPAPRGAIAPVHVVPGEPSALTGRDPRATLGFDKADAKVRTDELVAEMGRAQNHLYAEGTRALLLVLQGMDASGKDGVVRRVFTGVNPQGCRVTSFKRPSDLELAHDYLWRVHAACPRRGEIGIFNRSHYEDLVTAEMIGVIDRAQRDRRIEHVNQFERLLVDEGTCVVKVFLHISRDEQRQRLQERVDDPEKRWKFNPGDLEVRAQWDAYHERFEEVLSATSTPWAPWHVVPADRNWLRDRVVAELVVGALTHLDPQLPSPQVGAIVVE